MYGLVLEGGGTRGAYHIGAYKALKERDIEIGAVTGTSIGALNGALIAQGTFDLALDLWENLNYGMLTNITEAEEELLTKDKLAIEDMGVIGTRLKSILFDRGIDIGPLRELIDDYVDEEKLRDSPMDFGMVTVNLSEYKNMEVFKDDIPEGEMKDYLLASAYLPIFKTEKLNGKLYLDGAFADNLPFHMLRNKGYGKLIFVRTHGSGITKKLEVYDSDIYISPREDLGSSLECDPERAKYNINLGYYDTIKVLDGLEGDKYYISQWEYIDFFKILDDLSDEAISKLEDVLRVGKLTCKKRSLFELIVPKLASMIGLDKDYFYKDLLISLIELKALNMNLNRFQVYSFEAIVRSINEEALVPVEEEGILNKLMKKIDIPMFNKENILIQVAEIVFTDK